MAKSLLSLALVFSLGIAATFAQAFDKTFDQYFTFDGYCAGKYFCKRNPDGVVQLEIQHDDMGGFTAKQKVHHGLISMEMKMPAGYSGGVAPCFYMIDNLTVDYHQPHDEIDFEFFGGQDPKSILISTNMLSQGQQFTEQFYFPFDPSADFHRYTLVWTPKLVAWLVDGTPIRVTQNVAGTPFPTHVLTLRGSIWWTPWSQLQPNYANGPIGVQYRNFYIYHGDDAAVPNQAGAWNPLAQWANGVPPRLQPAMNAFRAAHLKQPSGWAPIP